jgi:hypothetical protein
MDVLSILCYDVEINRCVTVRQHVLWVTNRWMFPLRYTWHAVTSRECIQRPKTPWVEDYRRGFLYIAVRI